MTSFLPLYRQSAPQPGDAMHCGLWFERFFSAYTAGFDDIDHEQRNEWLNEFSHAHKTVGDQDVLKAKAEHMQGLAASQGGQARIYHCAGSFITGLGNPHPLENGFTWHHTLGTPYLPGSAVKGLVRAVIETAFQGEAQARSALLQRWFGTAEKGDVPEHSGSFIFMDALPVRRCQLHVEVMTPHMNKWYEKGRKAPLDVDTQPGDWHAPVPITYLTARDLFLQVIILPRPGAGDTAVLQQELQDLWQALDYGLQYLGAGGKTAIGMGQMRRDEKEEKKFNERFNEIQQKKQREAELKSLSPAMQEVKAFINEFSDQHAQYVSINPNKPTKQKLNGVLHNKARALTKKALESADWSTDEKRAAAEAIEEWLPKLVQIELKDVRKMLAALKGNT